MSAISERINANIDRIGHSLSFSKLGGVSGTFSVTCIVEAADSGTLKTFLDEVELMGVVRPALKVTCKGDSGVIADDQFTFDGVVFSVRRAFKNYVGDTVVSLTVIGA